MKLIKFPRTRHFPFSRTVGDDDKVHRSTKQFDNLEVIVTQKYDGESTSIYKKHIHARSVDSKNHPSRNWVKQFANNFQHLIPENFRVCGENMYAQHSIAYNNLDSYFYGIAIFDDRNICLDWDVTKILFEEWNIIPVLELYRGIYNEEYIKTLWDESNQNVMEGFVVRYVGEIPYNQYGNLVAKFVRPSHVMTSDHWMSQPLIPNKLKP